MGVPSMRIAADAKKSNRTKPSKTATKTHRKLLVLGILLWTIIVILSIDVCNAENEQYWYYRELERLKQQVKPQSHWQNQQRAQQNYERPLHTYQQNFPPQQQTPQDFQLQNIGVDRQEQKQYQHNNHDHQHLLHHQKSLKIENTKYTKWTENETYYSSTEYNALGMAPLYNITNMVIDLFVDADEPIPDGYIIVEERKIQAGPKVQEHDYADLLKKYWAILLVAFIVLLTAALMPLIGLCFCCCRCINRRSEPFDKKHDTCRRFFLGLFLFLVWSGMIFGVIVAFATNFILQSGVENVTTSARYGVDDTRHYLKSTSSHIRHLLVENYNELNSNLKKSLDETAGTVVKQLEDTSKAVKLKQLNTFIEKLPFIIRDLERMKSLTNEMRTNASELNDGLRSVKNNLLQTLKSCTTAECKTVENDYEIGRLDQNGIDYNQLPDLGGIIDDVKGLLESSLGDNVQSGQQALESIEKEVQETIQTNVVDIKKALSEVGRAIRSKCDELSGKIEKIADIAGNNSYKYFEIGDDYIAKYSVYRYWAGLGISSVLLIVLVFVAFGLLCGICGRRPDGYGDDCCNKGAGARFLMCGVAVIFLTITVLLVISLALFLSGVVVRRGACDPLKNPENDQLMSYLDEFLDLNLILYPSNQGKSKSRNGVKSITESTPTRPKEPFRISHIITACHRNESIYKVLRLENLFSISDIENYPKEYGIYNSLNELAQDLRIDRDFEILSKSAKQEILQLSKSQLNLFDSDKFTDNLASEITKYNLKDLANRLRDTSNKIAAGGSMNDIRVSLKNQALILSTFQTNLVDPMTKGTDELIRLSTALAKDLRFGESSFEKAIMMFLREIENAEAYIKVNGTEFVQGTTKELLEGFTNDVGAYLKLVVNQTQNDVGRCGPISNVYNSMIVATCNRIVDPYNGFWAGVVWCLILFFPTIILSAKLSRLYQKSDPYPGQLVETEYLYDAYSEQRDNIPLANAPKNKRRRKHDRRYDARDRRGQEYYEESSPTTAPNPQRDTRYTDMAPKNWDGAPPRYQNPPIAPPASSEYERPPPYYYPGNAPEHD